MSSTENTVKQETAVDLPDLIDTGDSDYTTEDTLNMPNAINTGSTVTTAAPLMDDDWFGDSTDTGLISSEKKNDDDPFADVSFHPNEEKESADDLFSGMTVGEKPTAGGGNQVPELFDMFGSTTALEAEPKDSKSINDLMGSFSIDETKSSQKGSSSSTLPENIFAMPSTTSHQEPENPLGGILGSQGSGFIQNPMVPGGVMPFNFPPGMMMNPAFASQPLNYAAMASLLAQQQQYLGNISNFQQFGNMNAQGSGNVLPMGTSGGSQSAFPDIFQPSFANQAPTSTMNGPKKEDTRAFDFISVSFAINLTQFRTVKSSFTATLVSFTYTVTTYMFIWCRIISHLPATQREYRDALLISGVTCYLMRYGHGREEAKTFIYESCKRLQEKVEMTRLLHSDRFESYGKLFAFFFFFVCLRCLMFGVIVYVE